MITPQGGCRVKGSEIPLLCNASGIGAQIAFSSLPLLLSNFHGFPTSVRNTAGTLLPEKDLVRKVGKGC